MKTIDDLRTSFVGLPGLLKLLDAVEHGQSPDERICAECATKLNDTMLVRDGCLSAFAATDAPLDWLSSVSAIAWDVTPTQMRDFDAVAFVLAGTMDQKRNAA